MKTNGMIQPAVPHGGSRSGAALVMVMCVAGLLAVVGVSLTMITGSAAAKSKKIHQGVQALAIAEAGVADVLSRMGTNYVGWLNNSLTANYGGGQYSVVTRTDMASGNVLIDSTGRMGNDVRETIVELIGDIWNIYDGVLGAGDGILARGDITIDTAAVDINGSCHANRNVLHESGNTIIDGDVSACGVVQVKVASGFTKTPNATALLVPDFRPFDAWKQKAQNGGLYYGATKTFKGVDLRPGNGVVYVDGDVTVATRSTIVGTLVASGTITIDNQFTQTAFNTNWPSLLAGVDINENNRNTYYGLAFAGNNFTSRNRRWMQGGIVALNNVDIRNGITIDPLTRSPYYTPSTSNRPPPEVVVGGWLK